MTQSDRPRSSSCRLARSIGAVLLVAAGCQSPSMLPAGADNPGLVTSPRLKQANPLEIVVLPVENQTGRSGLPLEALRKHLSAALVDRGYSPLALEYVDGRTSEAVYRPGSNDEEGLLKLVVTGWNDRYWRTHWRLIIDAELWLLDPLTPITADALFGGHVQRRLEMGEERKEVVDEAALLDRALQRFADQALASLPARNPEVQTPR